MGSKAPRAKPYFVEKGAGAPGDLIKLQNLIAPWVGLIGRPWMNSSSVSTPSCEDNSSPNLR